MFTEAGLRHVAVQLVGVLRLRGCTAVTSADLCRALLEAVSGDAGQQGKLEAAIGEIAGADFLFEALAVSDDAVAAGIALPGIGDAGAAFNALKQLADVLKSSCVPPDVGRQGVAAAPSEQSPAASSIGKGGKQKARKKH